MYVYLLITPTDLHTLLKRCDAVYYLIDSDCIYIYTAYIVIVVVFEWPDC